MTNLRLISLAVTCAAVTGCFDDDDECYLRGKPDIASIEYRDPMTGICQSFGGGECDACGNCYDTLGAPEAFPDWGQCYSQCESLNETTCQTTSGCRAAYAGGSFHQCWAVAQSGPVQGGTCSTFDAQECSRHDDCVALHAVGSPIGVFQACAAETATQDPGSCVGPITCTTPEPQCPPNTLAGRNSGCWTGYCIPVAECDALPACSELTEMQCIGRSDCTPTYEGVNCTCTSSGCTCQSWVFDACKTN